MAFNFGGGDSSSENEAMADISAWQTVVGRKRSTPPRRTSGFQAVNQPVAEDITMQSSPEPDPIPAPIPAPAPAPARAPVAQMVPMTELTVHYSGEESSSDEEMDEPNSTAHAQFGEVEEVGVAPRTIDIEHSPEAEGQEQEAVSEAGQRSNRSSEQPLERSLEPKPVEEDEIYVPPSNLEVFIPNDELDEEEREEYEDFTAGGDVVFRVLNELTGEDGMMEYTVEFEDRHIEQVSLTCDCTRLRII